jgi:hypothetical protein
MTMRFSTMAFGFAMLALPTLGRAAEPSASVNVAIRLDFDPGLQTVRGVKVDLRYDPTRVSLPGSHGEPAVVERVQGAAKDVKGKPAEGLVAVNDHAGEGEKVDDTLTVGYAAGDDLAPGDAVVVRFEQTTSGAVQASDFSCLLREAADDHGIGIASGVTCRALVVPSGSAPAL